jgi:hypothetical protein
VVAEIERRTLDGIPFFVDNKAEAPLLVKESHSEPVLRGSLRW